MRRQYPFHLIEPKWQQHWDREQTFRAWNPGDVLADGHPFAKRHGLSGKVAGTQLPPKYYILDMFPYPSGTGLHVGHPEGYTATDILARYRRARGFNVLHPMGWDSFGLPAEQYAVKTGQHPRKTTEENIANFTRQIKSLGFSYDWTREVATTDPEYFRWTQWIFLKLYNSWSNPETTKAEPIETLKYPSELQSPHPALSPDGGEGGRRPGEGDSAFEEKRRTYRDSHRLAYVSEAPVNWCPELGTVLANEEVIDGKSEVGGFPVIRRPMRQWMLRITAYAEKLLADLDTIDWSDSLKEMQRNWIGKSEGAEVDFRVAASRQSAGSFENENDGALPSRRHDGGEPVIRVFSTRPDTLFGATYMVLAPEHKLVDQITPTAWPDGVPSAWIQGSPLTKAIEAATDEHTQTRAASFEAEVVQLTNLHILPEVLALIPGEVARRHRVIPVKATASQITVALADPADLPTLDALASLLKQELTIVVAAPSDIEAALNRYYRLSPREAVANYRAYAARKSDLERTELAKEKTGVFTGAYAINPVNGEKIPIWIADYVLASYGTGAIMAVPAHDERDWEFAKKFNLEIKQVVIPKDLKPIMLPDGRQIGGAIGSMKESFCEEGIAFESPESRWRFNDPSGERCDINGLPTAEAKAKITGWLESKGLGKKTVNYKLRDWLFSRQRYWGEPFPIIWKKDAAGNLYHEALPESALPLLPPALEEYKPTADGQPPLARAKDWLNLPDGSIRETNTMPQWAGSCWYYLRYLDAKNGSAFVSKEAESYWMGSAPSPISQTPSPKSTPGVDLYVGGTEHAVLHLLYARFWHKVLFDLGYVSTAEPFFKLVNQGIILGELEFYAFVPASGSSQGFVTAEEITTITEWISAVDVDAGPGWLTGTNKRTGAAVLGLKLKDGEQLVEKRGDHFYLKSNPMIRVGSASFKMSKSRGNVVNPDDILVEYGADAFRLYEMFMGPLQDTKPWNTNGVAGVYKFLGRVWRLFIDEKSETEFEQAETVAAEGQKRREMLGLIKLSAAVQDTAATPAQLKVLHTCIKKVTEDLDGMRFNTAISAMMVFVNDAIAWEVKPVSVMKPFLQLLAPFAPHVAEELWEKLHSSLTPHHSSLTYSAWPSFDATLLVESTLEIPVQVNGKLRDKIVVASTATNAEIEAAALASEKVKQFMEGKPMKKIIVVPKKLVNIVV